MCVIILGNGMAIILSALEYDVCAFKSNCLGQFMLLWCPYIGSALGPGMHIQ